jgi:membrane-bound lytic murein transglycosylase D
MTLALAGCLISGPGPDGVRTPAPVHSLVGDPESPDEPAAETLVVPPPPPSPVVQRSGPQERRIWARLRDGFDLGRPDHPRIDREVRRLQNHPQAWFALMSRGEPYLHYVLDEIEAAGLPTELALLPAVESGFRPRAYSSNGAAGLWQFMPATGDSLGLSQDWWFDRRRTVRQSTAGAIVYLERLHERFDGDWLHALAAYNAGAGRVGRAIRRARAAGRTTDYWSLDLPAETDAYIPRLFALARIIEHPEAHGLALPNIPDRPYFDAVATGGQIDLQVAADLAGVELEELLDLNAGNKRWTTPPDGPHVLLLPRETVQPFRAGLAALPPDSRVRWARHEVRRGESLSVIARNYGVSIAALKRANGLTDSRIRAGSHLVVPRGDDPTALAAASQPVSGKTLRYEVRRGDSLYTIARRFQVSIADLKRWNEVGRFIHPGQQLTLYLAPGA